MTKVIIKNMSICQNAWNLTGKELNRQRRRSELVKKWIDMDTQQILDIGCAEGFTTKYIKSKTKFIVGIELDFDNLRIAKQKVKGVFYINGSIDFLPFKNEYFDAVTVLEVLEHLPKELQHKGLNEVSRVLLPKGRLIISVPYKEKIIKTKCIHCKNETPLYGHLHSLDEDMISEILPKNIFKLLDKYNMPCLAFISCADIFKNLPLTLWLFLNNILGKVSKTKGYWIVLKYIKKKQ